MITNRTPLTCIAMLAIGLSTTLASAAFTIRPDVSTVSTTPNGTATVNIILAETNGTVLRDAGGLYSFGFTLSRTAGTATVTTSSVNANYPDAMSGSTAAASLPATTYRLGREQKFEDAQDLTGPGSEGSGQVILTTLLINAGQLGGTFSLSDFGALSQTVLYDFNPIDDQITYSGFTVAVPEPASTSLLFIGMAATLHGRRRRVRVVTCYRE